jgi:catechol 2,3-dioxygenase-like lactoylglutathione lyase family enzyme
VEETMFDHIGLHVRDLAASIRFYEAVLSPLGHKLCSRDETSAGFGSQCSPAGPDAPALFLYLARGSTGAGTHVALHAKHRGAVRGFHEQGLQAGGKDNGAPGVRADYSPNYYAAFLLDPDGNNVEAVCTAAK